MDIFTFTKHPLALFAITSYYSQDLSLRINRLLQCTRLQFYIYRPGILDAEYQIIELVIRFQRSLEIITLEVVNIQFRSGNYIKQYEKGIKITAYSQLQILLYPFTKVLNITLSLDKNQQRIIEVDLVQKGSAHLASLGGGSISYFNTLQLVLGYSGDLKILTLRPIIFKFRLESDIFIVLGPSRENNYYINFNGRLKGVVLNVF